MYKLIIKGTDHEMIRAAVKIHLPKEVSIISIHPIGDWEWNESAVNLQREDEVLSHKRTEYLLNIWMTKATQAPFPIGALLWWTSEDEGEHMEEISFGPVSNADGSPTEMTKQMLAGTGRELRPPFGPVTVISAEGSGKAYLHDDDHLEMIYEDQHPSDMDD